MRSGSAARTRDPEERTSASDSAVILNVNDHDDSRLVTSFVLQRAGYNVVEAATGIDALRLVRTLKPQLVILDVGLPDIDGFEVCQRIKADPATTGTAVLHLSAAHPGEMDKVRGLEGGADGYLTAPVEPPVLVATVKSLIRVRRAEAQLEASEAGLRRVAQELRELNEQLEERVRERTAELEAALQELEAFSYSISHDLRAPLRAIGGFSGILLNEYTTYLPPEGQRYLRLVVDNVQEMGQLINDLLTFSRTGREPLRKQRVELTELVRQSLDVLQHECEGRETDVRIGPLPACTADPALLKQVLVNLLSNALKFTRRRSPAIIEVGCRSENGRTVYFVRDNGVGFDMLYAHKLFGVFQRLHSAQEYEGTGVGLAIAQRIVQRHGGRLWAEAEVDRGAVFYFTLGEPS